MKTRLTKGLSVGLGLVGASAVQAQYVAPQVLTDLETELTGHVGAISIAVGTIIAAALVLFVARFGARKFKGAASAGS